MSPLTSTTIPSALASMPHWVAWKREVRDGKPTKVPYNAHTGAKASVSDSGTWCTFSKAVDTLPNYDGVGFVLTQDLGIVGIDLDHCVEAGKPNEWAQSIIDRFNTYTEFSPSGEGIRMWLYGELPQGRRRTGAFEIYTEGRYLTVTGNRLPDKPLKIQDGGQALLDLYNEMFPPVEPAKQSPTPLHTIDQSDSEILRIMFAASNGADIERLWRGDTSAYDGDDSRADSALCSHLAFYCGANGYTQVDSLFRQSGLMRPKWDSKRGTTTYGQITINNAYQQCRDFYSGGHGSDSVRLTLGSKNMEDYAGWDTPIDLVQRNPEEFELDVLPKVLREYVQEIARVVQVPVDMAAMMCLAVCSGVVSRRFEVKIGHTHEEPTNLYVAIAAEPGTRKSQLLSSLTFPLVSYEKKLALEYKDRVVQSEEEAQILDADIQRLRIEAKKETDPDRQKYLTERIVEKRASVPNVGKCPRLLVDDITPEGLSRLLAEQEECMTMCSDEGGIFQTLAGRYSDGNMNLDLFLKCHDGSTHRTDRINRDGEILMRPRLAIGLCVQPDVLHRSMKKEMKGRGLMGRFLFCIPKDLRGTRMYNRFAPGMDMEKKLAYQQALDFLLDTKKASSTDYNILHTLRLDDEAMEYQEIQANRIERKMAADCEFHEYADWASKIAGRVARIAAVMHAVSCASAQIDPREMRISKDAIMAAWEIGGYLVAHMKKAYQISSARDSDIRAEKILGWIFRKEPTQITLRDVMRFVHITDSKEAREALNHLVDTNHIRYMVKKNDSTGKTSEYYEVNPHIFSKPATNGSSVTSEE